MSDKKSLDTLRRDKLSAIIEHGQNRIQRVITGAGIDSGIARVVAATIIAPIIRQALPASARAALAEAEAVVLNRTTVLCRSVYQAKEDELDQLPDE